MGLLGALAEVQAAITLNDGLGFDDVVAFAAGITTIITALWLILKPVIKAVHDMDARAKARDEKMEAFWSLWDGTPESPGRDAVPGVPERLQRLDGELRRNGGNSIKDQVFAIRREVDAIKDGVNKLNTTNSVEHVELQKQILEIKGSRKQRR